MKKYNSFFDVDFDNLFDYETITHNVDMYGSAHMCTLQELLHATKIELGSDDYFDMFDELEDRTGSIVRINDYGDVVAHHSSGFRGFLTSL